MKTSGAEMKDMSDPYLGLISFVDAYKWGVIAPRACMIHKDLKFLLDTASDGVSRMTFAAIAADNQVKGYAVYIWTDPYKGLPCVSVGYAVAKSFRNQGVATDILRKSISEMQMGLKKKAPKFYVDAIVANENVASIKVATKVLCATPIDMIEEISGKSSSRFFKLVE